MKAVIISVGDELISGKTVDTNSAYLADQLTRCGIATIAHWTVGDCQSVIARTIADAAAIADIVLVSGGLGPTADDVTRQALADAMGVGMQVDPPSLAVIEGFFRSRGLTMAPINRMQAMVPVGAQVLPNSAGTAPGIAAALGEAMVYVTPGVPHEMKRMFEQQIAPRLPRGRGAIVQKVLHTFGMGESTVGEMLGELMTRDGPVLVGTTVAAGLVSVRITASAPDADRGRTCVDGLCRQIRQRLGDIVFGEDEDSMAGIVGHLLNKAGKTLATAESCTGGMIGQMITAVPGSSSYYLGGMITYSNALKMSLLGVSEELLKAHGAVSEPVARAMAQGCRAHTGADYAISVTGVAGPAGGTADKPVGLVHIAMAHAGGTEHARSSFPSTREIVRLRAALSAMNMLRLHLQKN
ncbi:MAG: competence/damage-inducible protein A [Planctomycetaceae bacterium]|nr:competence/damage-inducible protein A [Planctomycetaceae bacterium]